MTASRNNIILVVLGILVAAAALYMLFGRGSTEDAVQIENAPASQAETNFLNLTAEIEPVDFDASVLADPRFMALQDISTAIVPESAGRVDPFAPLGGL